MAGAVYPIANNGIRDESRHKSAFSIDFATEEMETLVLRLRTGRGGDHPRYVMSNCMSVLPPFPFTIG